MATIQKSRKRFNRIVKSLSEYYERYYKEVEKLYYKMNGDISKTRMLLGLITTTILITE